jgi:Cdc6-like AAA superfamily ATPase
VSELGTQIKETVLAFADVRRITKCIKDLNTALDHLKQLTDHDDILVKYMSPQEQAGCLCACLCEVRVCGCRWWHARTGTSGAPLLEAIKGVRKELEELPVVQGPLKDSMPHYKPPDILWTIIDELRKPSPEGKNVFLLGAHGMGKSMLVQYFLQMVRIRAAELLESLLCLCCTCNAVRTLVSDLQTMPTTRCCAGPHISLAPAGSVQCMLSSQAARHICIPHLPLSG